MIFKLQFQYLLVGCLLSVTCICQEVRNRIFQGRPECGFDEGSVFQGSVFQAIPGISELHCAERCTKDRECKSINYEKKTRTCQLSNTTAPTCGALTALANHTYLEKRVSYFYFLLYKIIYLKKNVSMHQRCTKQYNITYFCKCCC